jgi:hypothetical protein
MEVKAAFEESYRAPSCLLRLPVFFIKMAGRSYIGAFNVGVELYL